MHRFECEIPNVGIIRTQRAFVLPKCLVVIGVAEPAQTSRPVLLTRTGISSLTGKMRIMSVAGMLVLVPVLATRVI